MGSAAAELDAAAAELDAAAAELDAAAGAAAFFLPPKSPIWRFVVGAEAGAADGDVGAAVCWAPGGRLCQGALLCQRFSVRLAVGRVWSEKRTLQPLQDPNESA